MYENDYLNDTSIRHLAMYENNYLILTLVKSSFDRSTWSIVFYVTSIHSSYLSSCSATRQWKNDNTASKKRTVARKS